MFRFSFTSALLVPVSKERKKPHITVVIIVADIMPRPGRIAKKEKKKLMIDILAQPFWGVFLKYLYNDWFIIYSTDFLHVLNVYLSLKFYLS